MGGKVGVELEREVGLCNNCMCNKKKNSMHIMEATVYAVLTSFFPLLFRC